MSEENIDTIRALNCSSIVLITELFGCLSQHICSLKNDDYISLKGYMNIVMIVFISSFIFRSIYHRIVIKLHVTDWAIRISL